MGMEFAPTWLRQVSPLLHKTTLTTDLDHLVVSATDEVHSVCGHVERVDTSGHGAVQLAHHGPVQRLPVGQLAVGARGQQLVLQRMILDVLEQRVHADHLTTASRPG